MAKKKWYAVKKGVKPGVYQSWAETEAQVKGYSGAVFKGFTSEAEARQWFAGNSSETGSGPKTTAAAKSKTAAAPKKKVFEYPQPRSGELVIYTDGGAINNPGPGGFGAVLLSATGEKELCAGYRYTTNNRMELTACIVALQHVEEGCRSITLYSDSSYVVNGITKGWAKKWRRSGWIKSDKKKVLNQDLWEELLCLAEKYNVDFRWVRGHAGNPLNERCDRLAVQSARGADLLVDHGYEASY
ncbi:MAG: ribonuclease HI [Desulfopila sp.]